MDVHLLTYDLSGGLAKQMSAGLLGFQLDAIYHTSIELDGMEYVYDGGIRTIRPGTSHLGQPLERIHLGKTELPMEVIVEYLDSLREIYTPQAYDLFRHNCNNFSNDFSMFLIGKGIPEHITNMPQTVLDSPLGMMLQPRLAQMVEERKAQQGGLLGIQDNVPTQPSKATTSSRNSTVMNVTNIQVLDKILQNTKINGSCAIIFFTMASCGPCKVLYPLYDNLAKDYGEHVTFVKVDIRQAYDISTRYSITATPTFMTFQYGEELDRWMGGDKFTLERNVEFLSRLAKPSHPHMQLSLPHLEAVKSNPVLYQKVPPLPKLLSKLGPKADEPPIQEMKHFIETRTSQGPSQATLPDLQSFSGFLRSSAQELPKEILFTVVDLFRCALMDPRISGWFAEEEHHATVVALLNAVNKDSGCPYPLRLTTLQMACNLFSSHLYSDQVINNATLRNSITDLLSSSFLDDNHNNIRVAASSLLFNVASANYKKREEGAGDVLTAACEVELAASVLEAIRQEESSSEALHGMLLGLGYLAYRMPMEGDMVDLLKVMDAQGTVLDKKKKFPDEPLVEEVGTELLGKGLQKA